MQREPNERSTPGFTIVEVLVVMAIILVLAGLVLGTSSYVHNKAARSRAAAEIAALSAALENYKADNGVYPESGATDILNAQLDGDPAIAAPNVYTKASLFLYESLSGDKADRTSNGGTSYFNFKDNQLSLATGEVQFIKDPYGISYGYSTKYQADVTTNKSPPGGYNPTFDLWSTSGTSAPGAPNPMGWVKNW